MTEIKDYITNDFKGINSEETIAEVHDLFHELFFAFSGFRGKCVHRLYYFR